MGCVVSVTLLLLLALSSLLCLCEEVAVMHVPLGADGRPVVQRILFLVM